jgi:hypothetical protein
MMPHNSHAGKNAPNKSKEGAPAAEQPPRPIGIKKTRRAAAPMDKRAAIFETLDTRIMTID